MASDLAQLTDSYLPDNPIGSGLPVERLNVYRGEAPALSEFNTSVGTKVDDILNKLSGANGQERYQLWPEKVIREGLSAAGTAMKEGTINPGLRREDFTDIPAPDMPTNDSTALGKLLNLAPVAASPQDKLIEQAQAISALAGTGGLAGGVEGTALNATPSLRPALRYKDKLYKGQPGQQHLDVIPKDLYPEFEKMAMSGEDLAHYNFGFMNHKGQFLDREKALEYAINEGLVDAHAGQYGALTSTLMADSSKPGTAIEAMKANPFYSAVERNVKAIPQDKMTGEQWLGTLSNKPGVKPEELQWTGLKDFLEENKGKPITKEQVQEHLASNKVELKEVNKEAALTQQELTRIRELQIKEIKGGLTDRELGEYQDLVDKQHQDVNPTKYHSYQLPGGENYREMLMTLPPTKNTLSQFKVINEHGHVDSTWTDKAKADAWAAKNKYTVREDKPVILDGGYKSSHWDEPNILAHVRMNDRIIDGKKSLHLEEIQSDWHQQGRDKGYKLSDKERARADEIIAQGDKVGGVHNLSQAIQDEAKALSTRMVNDAPPDAPFKKSWHELALKRMIREAAEKGYDRLSWTQGEAQAARYDLSKSLDTLSYKKTDQGYQINGSKDNRNILDHFATKEELPNVVGKEMAQKIIEGEGRDKNNFKVLSGLDLKIGGEGMKGFYDQIIPKTLEKLGKEHGVKVKQGNIMAAMKKIGDSGEQPVHYIDLPKSLKDQAMRGFPLFSSGVPIDLLDNKK